MNVQAKEPKAPVDPAALMGKLPTPPKFDNLGGRAAASEAETGGGLSPVFQIRLRRGGRGAHHRA